MGVQRNVVLRVGRKVMGLRYMLVTGSLVFNWGSRKMMSWTPKGWVLGEEDVDKVLSLSTGDMGRSQRTQGILLKRESRWLLEV